LVKVAFNNTGTCTGASVVKFTLCQYVLREKHQSIAVFGLPYGLALFESAQWIR